MEPDCVLAGNCSFGILVYVFREANMGVYAPLYMQYLYMYVQYESFESDNCCVSYPCFPSKQNCFHIMSINIYLSKLTFKST